jgi:PEP-CTERM motif-containing protein
MATAPVPEASTRVMMIAGFGLIGVALRRRLTTIAFT